MISVIIPTYNRQKLISRAIVSIVNQTYRDWELIIADDGSTDDTELVVKQFSDSRIKYLKLPNRGATAARNSGASVANGEYLTFLDSDDEAKIVWLQTFYNEIEKGNQIVCCGYEYIDGSGNLIGRNYPKNMGSLYGNRVGRFTNGGVFILKKRLFDEINGYDEKVKSGQHSELAIRLFQILDDRNIKIKNLYETLIKVHVHTGEKIRNDDKAIYEGVVYVINKHQTLFDQNKNLLINYLKVGAVSAFRLGKHENSSELFWKAYIYEPFNFKTFLQFCFSKVPSIGRFVWSRRSQNSD